MAGSTHIARAAGVLSEPRPPPPLGLSGFQDGSDRQPGRRSRLQWVAAGCCLGAAWAVLCGFPFEAMTTTNYQRSVVTSQRLPSIAFVRSHNEGTHAKLPAQTLSTLQGLQSAGHPLALRAATEGVSSVAETLSALGGAPVLGAALVVAAAAAAAKLVPSGASRQGPQREALKADLLRAIEGTNRGAGASVAQATKVDELAAALELFNPTAAPTRGPLSQNYELLYTTEQSLHPFLRRLVLGLPVVDVGQRVSLEEGRVFNRIELPAGTAVRAEGPLKVTSPTRISYRFDRATAVVFGLPIPVPLKAGGWSETRYLDADLRVVRNSRGDSL
eukprot:EG_transcript_17798